MKLLGELTYRLVQFSDYAELKNFVASGKAVRVLVMDVLYSVISVDDDSVKLRVFEESDLDAGHEKEYVIRIHALRDLRMPGIEDYVGMEVDDSKLLFNPDSYGFYGFLTGEKDV